MKVKDLLKEIEECREEYGDEFLEWDVYTEQLTEYDKKHKRKSGWEYRADEDEWEYFKCNGFWTKDPKQKWFSVNVNF